MNTITRSQRNQKAAAWLWLAIPFGIVLAGYLPLALASYLPLYDYLPHLFEAQAVLTAGDPSLFYNQHIVLQPGWLLSSNALATLLLVWLGKGLGVETAGRVLIGLYMVGLVGGWAVLLRSQSRPVWLLLALPPLLYNLTFTSGMLNWSLGMALLPWVLWVYHKWTQSLSPGWLAALALLAWVSYAAHALAWGAALAVLLAVATADGMADRQFGLLALAAGSPILLLSAVYPWLALAAAGLVVSLWALARLTRRLGWASWHLALFSMVGGLLYLGAVKLNQDWLEQHFPAVGYSLYAKLTALTRTFSLPFFHTPLNRQIVVYDYFMLGLLAIICGLLLGSSLRTSKHTGSLGWEAALGVLLAGFALLPTRTYEIVATEPRLILAAALVGLLAARLPPAGHPVRTGLVSLLVAGAVTASGMNAWFVWQYDQQAQIWASRLSELPPGRSVLVLPDPPVLPEADIPEYLLVGQVFEPSQFTSLYALRTGGFVSNTFFNGPLRAAQPQVIPPYWNIRFRSWLYLESRCQALLGQYDLVVVWQPHTPELIESLERCYGGPQQNDTLLGVWDGR